MTDFKKGPKKPENKGRGPVQRPVRRFAKAAKPKPVQPTQGGKAMRSVVSEGFKSAGRLPVHRSESRGLPQPREMMPEQNEAEKRLAQRIEREAELDKHTITPDTTRLEDLKHVPLDEELETTPEKVAEYCEREPFLLTDMYSLDKHPRFGVINARFKAMAYEWQKKVELIDTLRSVPKEGKIPARLEVKAWNDEHFAELLVRARAGEDMGADYDAAKAKAAEYNDAADLASDLYHKQMQKTFRQLESAMNRKEIGMYAQSMWILHCADMQKEYEYNNANIEFRAKLFHPQVGESEDKSLQYYAAHSAFQALKWIAFNINEIPLDSDNSLGRAKRGLFPKPKPTIN